MSSDPEQVHFADGIAEEVLNLLARVRELRVISRSSAFALRDRDLNVPEIGEILDVGHVLEGSVRKDGNRVRVTAQLIEARTDTHLWSETYTEELDDVFRIQDEIAADVAKNLRITLLKPLPRSRYVDPEVKALTDQAKLLAQSRPVGVGDKMHDLLSRALDIDPDYVPALETMTYANYFRKGEGLISGEEEQRLYEEAVARIRKLEPDNAFVDFAEALSREFAGNYEEAAELYLRALSKDMTDSEYVRLAGNFARRIGKVEVSIRLLQHSVAIDPLCFQCLYQLSTTYLVSGDYESALEARARYIGLGSGGHYYYGLILLLQGKPQAALDYVSGVSDIGASQAHAVSAMAWHSLGDRERATAEFEKLLAADDRELPLLVAGAAAWMGDTDTAFNWLQKAQPRMAAMRLFLPIYESLRDDPRWDEFRESIGASAARLDAIEFDPLMPE